MNKSLHISQIVPSYSCADLAWFLVQARTICRNTITSTDTIVLASGMCMAAKGPLLHILATKCNWVHLVADVSNNFEAAILQSIAYY